MSKNKKKIIIFTALVLTMLLAVSIVIRPQYDDGIYAMDLYYEQPKNSVDLLIMGSSHAFENINTAVLWNEKGYSSFVLAGSSQPFWNTYFFLKEALEYQTPKLIVLDVFAAVLELDYAGNSTIIKNTFGIKSLRNRFEAIKVSAPKEDWLEYFVGIPAAHSMIFDMSLKDLLPYKGDRERYWCFKGFASNYSTLVAEKPDVSHVKTAGGITEKEHTYLIKIIELAAENDIELLLVKAPYPSIAASGQERYNQVAQIAALYKIPFINYNLPENEVDLNYATDFADEAHLNYRGNVVYTRELAEYIEKHYKLPDHRGDAYYSSWDANSEYILRHEKEMLS